MLDGLVFAICAVALLIGTYTDLKTREVPDIVNYCLIFTGFGVAMIYSVVKTDWFVLLGSIAGFFAMFVIACAMFYTGQWGGGDSKMLMALGALIGIPLSWPFTDLLSPWGNDVPLLFSFLVYSFVAGAFYGLIWSIVAAFRKRKEFFSEISSKLKEKKIMACKYVLLFFALFSFIVVIAADNLAIKVYCLAMSIVAVLGFYASIFIRTVERVCMIKAVDPARLSEGDWIEKDVVVDGKYVAGKKDLGVSREQINSLVELKKQNKLENVVVKEGVPFVPSFLIGFLLAHFLGLGWLVGLSAQLF